MVPESRISRCNSHTVSRRGRYVLYWMIAQRRLGHNFALQRAAELARDLDKPLLVLEALRCGYRWASDRIHRFILDGMAEREGTPGYWPYVEPAPGAGKGLLAALARDASAVVTDDFPCFFLPRMVRAAGPQLGVTLEAVDGNGVLPLRLSERTWPSAYAFRRFMQKNITACLVQEPQAQPLELARAAEESLLDDKLLRRWPRTLLARVKLAELPIDHSVLPTLRGGSTPAAARLERFVHSGLGRYADDRNEIENDPSSGLSPYLHFGHIGTHQVLGSLAGLEGWTPARLAQRATGKRAGFWGMSEGAEAFLDQIVTWRELGYHFCAREERYDRFESLPLWAQNTLTEHASDKRKTLYNLAEFDSASTHDPLWNAAQRQLRRDGIMHNYLRMLWGKKILEWTASPQEALNIMIEMNNRYALDGRDPNSYSGIFWCLGRFDRPWGPRRPVFGSVRYMSSESTARKMNVRGYLTRYGA